jgi:hypothetical protein
MGPGARDRGDMHGPVALESAEGDRKARALREGADCARDDGVL